MKRDAPCILVVDDEQEIRDTLAELFQLEDYRTLVASDGVEALAQLEATSDIALIILDLKMPRMTGQEFLRLLQARSRWASIPVIVSTSDPASAPSGVLLMKKPVHVERLLEAVKGLVDSPAARHPVPHRVLLIEGDADLSAVLERYLDELGFDVTAAPTLRDGLRALAQSDFSFVLSDWLRTPGEPPLATMEIVQRRAAPAPVLLMTGYRGSEDPAARGFGTLLRKPFRLSALAEAISHVTIAPARPAEEAAAHSYFRALCAADWDGLAALCTEHVRYELPVGGGQHASHVEGRRAFRDFSEATFRELKDVQFRVRQTLTLPSALIARYTGTWRGQQSGVPGAVLFQFEDGLISFISVRLDPETLPD